MKQNMDQALPGIAYFCMEYGLHEEFQIYAGGLGILAGDILKSANDLKVPMVGIGILWHNGYTNQFIGDDGIPYDVYSSQNYDFLEDTGNTVTVKVREEEVKVKIWKVDKYNNVPLYLLDTHVEGNSTEAYDYTKTLYGGSYNDRIAQELILGVGGMRAIKALNLDVEVYHFNEGHAVFAGLELIKQIRNETHVSFSQAWDKAKQHIVFTTHTPVVAGNEEHSIGILKEMGLTDILPTDEIEDIGGSPFNMTSAGLRLAKISNAVSKLHQQTAADMWKFVRNRAPIIAITNGVHGGTWANPDVISTHENNDELWDAHINAKIKLFKKIEDTTGARLDPNTLTMGFARRAAAYKRGNLIFHNREEIEPLLEEGKLQLVFSGKAHPHDEHGKAIISKIYMMSKRYPQSVVFLENYNMLLGRLLTQGCDVWLNTPVRPLEASGTSGMKAAMNGVLNLSILDGWWPEGCRHSETGWQIGDEHLCDSQDTKDFNCLMGILKNEVIPTYYDNKDKWIDMMKCSIEMSKWQFSSDRMVKDYVDNMYSMFKRKSHRLSVGL